MSLRVLIADDHPKDAEGIFGRIGGKDPDALTDRELNLLQLLADGLSTREIAAKLNLPEETVKKDLGLIYRKLRTKPFFGKQGEKGPVELTDREEKVQKGMADGLSTKEIAARLNLPEETVKTNLRSLRQKLGIRYWTKANPKSILKEFWHRTRKGK